MMDLARTIALFACAFALILGSMTLKRDPTAPPAPAPVALRSITASYACWAGREEDARIEQRCAWVRRHAVLPRAHVYPYIDYGRFLVTEWSDNEVHVRYTDGSLEWIQGPVTVSDVPDIGNGQSLSIGFKSAESAVQTDRQEQR